MKSKPKQPTTQRTIDADRLVRDYYESQPPSDTEVFPSPLDMTTHFSQQTGRAERSDDPAELSGGDPDSSQQGIDTGEETPGGSNPTPDQDLVDDIGKASGVTYQDNEPLDFGEKESRRDDARWELNPASSEDYHERQIPSESASESFRSGEGKESRS